MAKRQLTLTRSTLTVTWWSTTAGGAVSGRADSTASLNRCVAQAASAEISASREAKRR
jgi:hypothetical protein